MDIRPLLCADIPNVQLANLTNLPENYFLKYYLYHALSWPQLSFVAIDTAHQLAHPRAPPKVVGYVLAKIDEENSTTGHITSLSVMRTHRRLGLAEKLMQQSTRAMREYYGASGVSLHVRRSNEAAIGLYTRRLGFAREREEKGYYADGEDAWSMKLDIKGLETGDQADQGTTEGADEGGEVGSAGKKDDDASGEKMRKVKVGRSMGVMGLVEKDESQAKATV